MGYNKVLFVGNDNVCRSPMAETIFRSLYVDDNTDFDITSRGLVVLFEEPYNEKTTMILYNHGMETKEKVAIQLKPEDFGENVLVLTMAFSDKLKVIEDYGVNEDVYTLKEFIGSDDELLDPYGEELDIYEACYQDMYQALEEVKRKLNQ